MIEVLASPLVLMEGEVVAQTPRKDAGLPPR